MPKLCSLVIAVLTASHAATAQGQPAPMSGVDDIAAHWNEKVLEASRLRTNGALDDALKGLEAALEMVRSLGEESSYFGVTLSRIGSVYLDQGKDQQAEMALSRCAPNLENSFGPEHREVGKLPGRSGSLLPEYGPIRRGGIGFQPCAGDRPKDPEKRKYRGGAICNGPAVQRNRAPRASRRRLRTALRLIEQRHDTLRQAPWPMSCMYLGNAYVQQGRFREGDPILRRALRSRDSRVRAGYPAGRLCGMRPGSARIRQGPIPRRRSPTCDGRSRPLKPPGARPSRCGRGFRVPRRNRAPQGRYAEAQALAERGVKSWKGRSAKDLS